MDTDTLEAAYYMDYAFTCQCGLTGRFQSKPKYASFQHDVCFFQLAKNILTRVYVLYLCTQFELP